MLATDWRTSSPTYSMIMSSLGMASMAYSPQLWMADRANLTGFFLFLSWLKRSTSESCPSVFFWSLRSAAKRRWLSRFARELPRDTELSVATLAAATAAALPVLPALASRSSRGGGAGGGGGGGGGGAGGGGGGTPAV